MQPEGASASVLHRAALLVQAELGDRLAAAGPAGDPAALRASLSAAVGVSVPQPPTEPVYVAYLLVVAVCEICRAVYAPLLPDGELWHRGLA